MKKYLCTIAIAIALLAALPSLCARAAGGDGFRIDGGGTVTVVSGHAAEDRVASMSFSLSVESENAARVEFQFAESRAQITEFRYDAGARKLNVYLAGTEALFSEGSDSLTVGRIVVLDRNGAETAAGVSVDADSLQYVYGSELKTMDNLDLPGTVQIGPAGGDNDDDDNEDDEDDDPAPAVTPAPTAAPKPTAKPGGVVVLTPSPVRPTVTARPVPTSTPAPTSAPGDSSQASGSEPGSTASPGPEKTPDAAGSLPSSPSSDGEITDGEGEPQGEFNPIILVAVAAIILFVIVAAMAVAVLRKVPKRRD